MTTQIDDEDLTLLQAVKIIRYLGEQMNQLYRTVGGLSDEVELLDSKVRSLTSELRERDACE